MFKKIDVLTCFKFGVIAAVLFLIPVFLYIRDTTYAQSWLLYLGSMFFFAVIIVYTLKFNKGRDGNANTVTMVFASHVTTIIGVVLSCIGCFILLSLMVPGYLSEGPAGKVAPDAPINAVNDKTNGLSFRTFIGATIINFSFGSFASLIFPFTAKRNQTKDTGSPYPLQNEKKPQQP